MRSAPEVAPTCCRDQRCWFRLPLVPVLVPLFSVLGLVEEPPTTPPLVLTPVPPCTVLRCELVRLEPVMPVVPVRLPDDIVPVLLEPMLVDGCIVELDGRAGVLVTAPGTGATEPPPMVPWPAQEPTLGVVPVVPTVPVWVPPAVTPAAPVAELPNAELPVAELPIAPLWPADVDCAKAAVDRAARIVAVRICLRIMFS
jgi:hypothetical protein